ncbi:MAG TPA: hypothetical protein VGM67_04670 [Gemmatimonadaceae bacterium]|jgi:hypothetical protein
MYSTCLFCHSNLGTNESIEHFPIGRRLVFDAARGRLWVVCRKCERWNLSPIEERWEAIEESERLFRSRKLRAQTDNIGLAKVGDGTELIRIGNPLRPEFAAWRYGAVFRQRLQRRSMTVVVAGSILGAGALALSGASAAAWEMGIVPPLLLPLFHVGILGISLRNNLRGTRVVGEHGKPLRVTRANLNHSRLALAGADQLTFHLQHSIGCEDLQGDRAVRAASTILAAINRGGASTGAVRGATTLIADAGDPMRAIALVAAGAATRSGDFEERAAAFARGPRGRTLGEAVQSQLELQERVRGPFSTWQPGNPGALFRLPRVQRLALEMALHESSEQHALDEELASLERAWREAEEIASISDALLLSTHTSERLTELKELKEQTKD